MFKLISNLFFTILKIGGRLTMEIMALFSSDWRGTATDLIVLLMAEVAVMVVDKDLIQSSHGKTIQIWTKQDRCFGRSKKSMV